MIEIIGSKLNAQLIAQFNCLIISCAFSRWINWMINCIPIRSMTYRLFRPLYKITPFKYSYQVISSPQHESVRTSRKRSWKKSRIFPGTPNTPAPRMAELPRSSSGTGWASECDFKLPRKKKDFSIFVPINTPINTPRVRATTMDRVE